MDSPPPPIRSEIPQKGAIITGFSVFVILMTVYCLLHGIQSVFPHLYYVPIILAAYWYQRKGVLYATGMGAFYFACVIFFTGYNPGYIVAAAGRVVAFIIIAAIVMVLSLRISIQQRDLAASEKKFRSIFEHVQAGIFLVDAGTHEILAVNPEGERLTGYTADEMVWKTCHRFICPAEKGKCPISDLKMTIDRSERVLLDRNGETVPVLKTVTAATIDGRDVLIENVIPLPADKNPGT